MMFVEKNKKCVHETIYKNHAKPYINRHASLQAATINLTATFTIGHLHF